MKIIYTGGGTMGSVSPLIAIHQKLNNKNNNLKSLWLGTKNGPEKEIIIKENIKFKSIVAGKFRRYFDFNNIIDLFKILIAIWQAFFILIFFKPNIVLSAGGFVSVPVVWVAFILGIPVLIHQQDIRPGLANKLMAPCAKKITVALDVSLKNFPKNKTVLAGNPVRQTADSRPQVTEFSFNNNLPILLVMGGGTGASAINNLVWESADELIKFCDIIHITGKNKNNKIINSNNYKAFEFLKNEMFDVLKLADIVVSRAGLSSLTELAYFKKACILIPIPCTHQEDNAEYFVDKKACMYLKQQETDKNKFIQAVQDLLNSENKKKELSNNIYNMFIDYSGEKIIKEICKIQKS
ncbi:MAG: undecaprenyldiphospho-muramoylpentapeptide beta-N-acetylglucosaminyltransferase [Patescibacteria group bacterium]